MGGGVVGVLNVVLSGVGRCASDEPSLRSLDSVLGVTSRSHATLYVECSAKPCPQRKVKRRDRHCSVDCKGIRRDPSTQILPTLGPKVCKYYLHWAIWIPRVFSAAQLDLSNLKRYLTQDPTAIRNASTAASAGLSRVILGWSYIRVI